jgi:predicted ATP-dependent endonuclease of OLD family
MKVQKVHIKHLKCLNDFGADLSGRSVIVAGENGVGKSTFLQAIQIAFGDKKKSPGGDGEWEVTTDKDGREWKFRVKLKDGKTTIETISPEGLKDVRVSALKEICGAVDFDIDEFVKMSETESGRKKQVEIYKSLFPEDVKAFIADQESRVKRYYDERTEINRDIKILDGAIKDHPLYYAQSTLVPIDTSELQEQINNASKTNSEIERIKEGVSARLSAIDEIDKQIAELEAKKKSVQQEINKANEWLKDKSPVDISQLTQKLQDANENNAKIDSFKELEVKKKNILALQNKSGELTALIDSSKQTIIDAIKDIEIPVDGLHYDEEKLLYNGVPVELNSMSTSEIMELGVRMKICENPEMPLIIHRAESIGKDRWQTILDLAKKHNLQVLAEQVERGNEKLTLEFIND